MWLLIEVSKEENVGKDEQRRILIDEGCMDIFEDGCGMVIECNGVDVHPNTPRMNEMDENIHIDCGGKVIFGYAFKDKCTKCNETNIKKTDVYRHHTQGE